MEEQIPSTTIETLYGRLVDGKLEITGSSKDMIINNDTNEEYGDAILNEEIILNDVNFIPELERIMNVCKDTIHKKNKDYAKVGKKFSQFDDLAKELNLTPETIWYIFFSKHKDAIRTYCSKKELYSGESISHRIKDAIIYLCILYGMVLREKKTIDLSKED